MLVLSAGAWRARATVYYPTDNSTRFRSIEYRVRLSDLLSDLPKVVWNIAMHGEKVVAQHFGSSYRISRTPADVGNDPTTRIPAEFFVVRIPLTGRATVDTVNAFLELEKRGTGEKEEAMVLRDLVRLVKQAVGPQPLSAAARDAETALDWLYQTALDLHPTLVTGGKHGRHAACANPESRRLGLTPQGMSKAKDLVALLFRDKIRAHNAVDEAVRELVIAGALDPVILNVLECQVRRDLFMPNENHELENIVLRSQYHRIAQEVLAETKGSAPLFFSAVHQVTSSMGVGYVDLPVWVQSIDRANRSIVNTAVRDVVEQAGRALFENLPEMKSAECPGVKPDDRCLVCETARDINRVLFDHNRNVMRRLAHGRTGTWFDPIGRGKVIRDRLAFDIRMVLMEQAIVEHALVTRSKTLVPETVACVDRQLTMLAKSVQQVKPKPDVRHRQWSGYAAGRLVKSLESRHNRPHFAKFSKGGTYIFAPHFGNHWWRVAIGVAYVLVLHEAERLGIDPASPSLVKEDEDGIDRVPKQLEMRYRNLLLEILNEAPKAGINKKAQGVLNALAATRGIGKAEQERQTNRLTRALATLEKPDGSSRVWQGCNEKTLEVTPNSTPHHAGWDRILTALMDETHAATLADALESAGIEGETRLADRLSGEDGDESAYRQACRVVETRMRRTLCLLEGQTRCEDTEKGFQARPDDEHALLLSYESEAATAFRSELPAIWPFLVESIVELKRERRDAKPEPKLLAKTTIQKRARWERKVAKAQLLARTPEATLNALGFDSPEVYRALVAEARGVPTDEKPGTDAWIKKADEALAPGASLERVRKTRRKLEGMRHRIARVHASMRPQPYPPPRLHAGREARSAAPANGNRTSHLPGVAFNLVRSGGEAPDGRPKHRAIGVFEGSGDETGKGERAALPLGLEVVDVVVEPDGSLRALYDGRENIKRTAEPAARALLSSFGVPELFSDATVSYDLTSDFRSLTMSVTPSLQGYALGEFELVLLEDGAKRQDIAKQLIDGLERSVAGAAGSAVRKLLAPLKFKTSILDVKIALALCKDENPEVKLEGNSLSESGAPPPLRVRIRPKVCLTLRHADEENDEALLARTEASPEILLDANGLHVETMGIDDKTLEGVEDALNLALDLEKIVCGKLKLPKPCPVKAVKIDLTSGTETVGQRVGSASHGIRIGVDATFRLPLGEDGKQCIVPLRVAFALADAEHVPDALSGAASAATEATVKTCVYTYAAAKGAETVSDWLASNGNEINIIGMKWQLDCKKGEERQCIRAHGQKEAVFDIAATIEKTDKTYKVRGISIKLEGDSVRIGLRKLEKEDRKALAQALVAQVEVLAESTFGKGFIGDRLKIEDEAIGQLDNGNLYFYANVTIRGVPYLGDVALGRMNLANATNPGELENAVSNWALHEIAKKLSEEIQGDVQIPHVGKLKLANDAVEITPQRGATGAELAVTGTLVIWNDIETKMTIKAPLPDLSPVEFETDPKEVETALEFVTDELVDLVPFAGDRIKIEKPRFTEIAPGTGRYGLLMGAKVNFDPFDLTIKAEKIVVGIDGVQLAGALKGRLPGSIPFVGFVLSRVGGTYYPGHDGTRRGLVVEADIVPGTSELAKIAKMDTSLDLSRLGSLVFTIRGDVIVLDSVPIFSVKGLVDLGQGAVRVDATTPEMLEKVLSAEMKAWMGRVNPDGSEGERADPSIGAETALSIFGAEIAETTVRANLAGDGRIKAHAEFDILLGSGHVRYESALDFEGATLDAGVKVALLKWEALKARVTANPDWASASIKVLFFELGIGAPSVDRLDSWTAAQALRGLLAMSLEDIAKLQPGTAGASIQKVTIGKDGKARAQEVKGHEDPNAKERERAEDSGSKEVLPPPDPGRKRKENQQRERPETEEEEEREVKEEDEEAPPHGDPDDPEEKTPPPKGFPPVVMMDMGFGSELGTLIYCHRIDKNKRRYIRVIDRRSPPDARTFKPDPDIDPTSVGHMHAFRWTPGDGALMPCVESREGDWNGPNWLWQREWVPLGTRDGQWSFDGCDTRSARAWLGVRSGEGGTIPDLQKALPVEATLACWDDGISATAGLYLHHRTRELAALVQCPQADMVPEAVKEDKRFMAVCGEEAESFVRLTVKDPPWLEPTGRLGNLVAPEVAYRLFEIARSKVLGQKQGTDEPATITFGNRWKATLYPEFDPVESLTVLIGDMATGAILGTGQIEDETVRTLILHESRPGSSVETSWTQALLEPWWKEVTTAGGLRHPNRTRPRAVRRYDRGADGTVSVLAWTLIGGEGLPPVEEVYWSWPTFTNGQPVETRQVEVETTPRILRYSVGLLLDVLARSLPRLRHGHEDKTQVIVTRDEKYYGLEFFAYLPLRGDGDARIVLAPGDTGVGAKEARRWTAEELDARERYARCSRFVSHIEALMETANTESGGDPIEIDLREWARDPGGTSLRLGLAHDPVDALRRTPGLECR